MQPGILLLGNVPARRIAELAQVAEKSGFGEVWLADERFYREVYSCLAVMALGTSRVQLGTCVTDPYSRHPAMTAAAIATLDEISGGRAMLGIGAGLSGFREMGVDRRKPAKAIREAIELICRLMNGETVEQDGEVVRFLGGRLNFEPVRRKVPVIIASNGPQGQALAGRMADGAIMEGCGSAAEARAFVARVREAAVAAGRDPASVRCIARLNLSMSADPKSARDTLRLRATRNLAGGHMGFTTLAAQGLALPEEALDKVRGVPYDAGLAPYEAILPFVSDAMVDAVTLGGTKDEVVARLLELRRAGIDSVIVSPNPPPGVSPDDLIREFGQDVWPAVERQAQEAPAQ